MEEDKFGGRKILFSALTGSHNYNLNDKNSDKDYKYFVLPTFDDLYKGETYTTQKVGEVLDYSVYDVRKLSNLLWKSNVNFLEVLYSKEIEDRGYSDIAEIFSMRDKISTMNLPYLYHACKGMYFECKKRIKKGNENTQHLVEKYGYDTKAVLSAHRILDVLERFYNSEFDFEYAIRYSDFEREFLLSIKHGLYSFETTLTGLEYKLQNTIKIYEPIYTSYTPDLDTKKELDDIIKRLVKNNI